mgnify:FL=1
MTFPVSIADVASTKNFPDASGIDLKEMLAGFMGGGPEHTDRKNIDYTNYEEGIYVATVTSIRSACPSPIRLATDSRILLSIIRA